MFFGFERSMAWELRQCWHLYLNRIRSEIELKNKPRDKARGSDARISIAKKRKVSSKKLGQYAKLICHEKTAHKNLFIFSFFPNFNIQLFNNSCTVSPCPEHLV